MSATLGCRPVGLLPNSTRLPRLHSLETRRDALPPLCLEDEQELSPEWGVPGGWAASFPEAQVGAVGWGCQEHTPL